MRPLSAEDVAEREEFTNRSMDRLMATARFGRQPTDQGEATEVVIHHGAVSGKEVSVAFRLADTEAVITEMEVGAACGICHHNPCTWRKSDSMS